MINLSSAESEGVVIRIGLKQPETAQGNNHFSIYKYRLDCFTVRQIYYRKD